jgi:cell division protein FtsQ
MMPIDPERDGVPSPSSARGSARLPARNVRRRKKEPSVEETGAAAPPPSVAPPPPKLEGESRAMRVLRGVVGFVMVVAIGGSVAWGARRYVKTSPRFAVNEIVTSGAKRRSPDELAVIAGVAKGQNVFSVDLDKARARLLADPWISDAELARQLPGTVFLRVTEREAAGMLATIDSKAESAGAPDARRPTGSAGETYLVTRDGAIIKRLEPGDPSDFHVVTGIAVQQLVDDREGTTRTIRRALDLAYDYERTPLAQRAALQEVHVEPNGEMTLVVGKSAVVIRMGAAPYRRKLDQALRVVAELDRRGAKPDAIMLDNDARPDRVVVRMR